MLFLSFPERVTPSGFIVVLLHWWLHRETIEAHWEVFVINMVADVQAPIGAIPSATTTLSVQWLQTMIIHVITLRKTHTHIYIYMYIYIVITIKTNNLMLRWDPFQYNDALSRYKISIIKIRRSWDPLIKWEFLYKKADILRFGPCQNSATS